MDETYTAIIWETLEPFNGDENISRDTPLLIERTEEEKEELKKSIFFQIA